MSTNNDRRHLETVFGDDQGTLPGGHLDEADREELRQLESLERMLTEHGHREPGESRRQHLWTRLEGRLDEAPARRRASGLLPTRAILMGAAAIAVIAFATVALLRMGTPLSSPSEAPVRSADVENEAGDRLDTLIHRATPLLMAVSNRSHGDELSAIDITSEQRLATRLAGESRALRECTDCNLTRRDRMLVAELEAVLMQVANTGPSARSGEIALLRETIENRQLLFGFALRELRKTAVAPRPERSRDA